MNEYSFCRLRRNNKHLLIFENKPFIVDTSRLPSLIQFELTDDELARFLAQLYSYCHLEKKLKRKSYQEFGRLKILTKKEYNKIFSKVNTHE
jgi:hypothetical protein